MDYPFKHLAAYERKDKVFYCGRETETNELYQMTFETDLILVYGASGVGKSSLIGCGLANRFKSYEWQDIWIRRTNDDINQSLTQKLNEEIGAKSNEQNITKLIKTLRRQCFKPTYLIFDQFEELYTRSCNEKEQRQFYQTIKTILSLNQPIKIIISIREEYLGYLYEFEKVIPQLFLHKCWIKPLPYDIVDKVLQRVIKNQNESNVSIQGDGSELAEAIKKIFRDNVTKTIDLPSFQILLDELYLRVTGDNKFDTAATLSAETCKDLGDMGDILFNWLNLLVEKCEKIQQIDAKKIWSILCQFITQQGTKQAQSPADIHKKLSNISLSDIDLTLSFFERERILYRINESVEFRHDALAKRVFVYKEEKIQLEEYILRKVQDKEYVSESKLNDITRLAEQLNVTPEQQDWIDLSRKEIKKRERRIIKLVWLAFAAIFMLALVFLQQWRKTERAYAAAKKLTNALSFYDDRFALANRFGDFYFIDKNGNDAGFGTWKTAEQFNSGTGFAKVIDFDDKKYIVDTCKNKYRYSNSINNLDSVDFDLQILELSGQNLIELPPEIRELTDLISLDLSRNKLESLPVEIGLLSKLTKLDLSRTQRDSLPLDIPSSIENLINLTELNLSYNHFKKYPAEIWGLRNLTKLILDNTSLDSIPPQIGELTKLTELNLSSNSLNAIPTEIGQLTNLTKLNLRENRLNGLPATIGQLTNLTELSLNNNLLKSLPEEIEQLTKVNICYLQDNEIDSIPVVITKLTNLKELDLSNNNIETLPAEIGKLINLETIDLGWNRNLKTLPATIGQLINLTGLDLRYNQIDSLPLEIGLLTKLIKFNLCANKLDSLPLVITKLTNLKELDLSNNNIESLPAEIEKLIDLEKLDLKWNKNLKTLPASIGHLTKLTELNLRYNPLDSLPAEIGKLINLSKLDLAGTNLKILPIEILGLINMKYFYCDYDSLHIDSKIIADKMKEIADTNSNSQLISRSDIIIKNDTLFINQHGEVLWQVLVHKKDLYETYFKRKVRIIAQFGPFAIHPSGVIINNNVYVFYLNLEYAFMVWFLIIAGLAGGIFFHCKKWRLYKWLCFGFAGTVILVWAALFAYHVLT